MEDTKIYTIMYDNFFLDIKYNETTKYDSAFYQVYLENTMKFCSTDKRRVINILRGLKIDRSIDKIFTSLFNNFNSAKLQIAEYEISAAKELRWK